MPILRIKLPNNQGEVTHILSGEKITIGRRPENTIQIIDRTVSAHHAELLSVNGHYRLHDLGSTNLTCIDGEPVTDFHLHQPCAIRFGTVEAEFSLETPTPAADSKVEVVPTRAELDFVRRENLDLLSKIAALQKQVDILGSARLMTKDTSKLGVHPDAHQKVQAQCEVLRKERGELEQQVDHLRADLLAVSRDRDALRQAWETVKGELQAAEKELERLRSSAAPSRPAAKASAPAAPAAPAGAARNETQPINADQHRQMAGVLTTAPGLIESIREALEKLAAVPANADLHRELASQAAALAAAAAPVQGHPIQRLASAIDALARELAPRTDAIEQHTLRALNEASQLLLGLLDPRALKRAKSLPAHLVLAVEQDQAQLAALVASLQVAELQAVGRQSPAEALEEVRSRSFDVVLLGRSLPAAQACELCKQIRALPAYAKVPVLGAGGQPDLEAASAWADCGGTDWMEEPYLPLELALKAQTWIYRNQFALL